METIESEVNVSIFWDFEKSLKKKNKKVHPKKTISVSARAPLKKLRDFKGKLRDFKGK